MVKATANQTRCELPTFTKQTRRKTSHERIPASEPIVARHGPMLALIPNATTQNERVTLVV